MNNTIYFLLSAIVFTFAGLLHGVRAALGWELTIGDYLVPNWVSAVTFIITAFLAYSGFKKLRKKPSHFSEL